MNLVDKIRKDTFLNLAIVAAVVYLQSFLSSVLFAPFTEKFYQFEVLFYHYPALSKKTFYGSIILFCIALGLTIFKPIKWKELPSPIQYIIGGSIFVLTWAYGLYEYNYYFDTWHLVDRFLLIGLAVYSLYNPYAIILFLVQLVIISKQFSFPDCLKYSFTDKKIVFDILTSFWLYLIAIKFAVKLKWDYFLLITFSIIFSWYFLAGLGKFQLNWLNENIIYNLFAAGFTHGWLTNISGDYIQQIGDLLLKYNTSLQVLAFIVELILPFFVLFNRRLTISVLTIYVLFHLGVLIFSGIFFWKWIVLELALIVMLIQCKPYFKNFFTLKYGIVYLVLLLTARFNYSGVKLAWLDSGYITNYTFYLVDEQAHKVRLNASFFTPHDFIFAQNRFYFLNNEKKITNTYGTAFSNEIMSLAKNWEPSNKKLEAIEVYRNKSGKNYFDLEKQDKFYRYLRAFINNKLAKDSKWISYVDAPMHILQGENQQNFEHKKFEELIIVAEEKVTQPKLQFDLIKSDTFRLDLKRKK